VMATGRSDYPNQINNVIAFPYIFRGALDTRARAITEEIKSAATRAIAALAQEPLTEEAGFDASHWKFGREALIPKPFDRRLLAVLDGRIVGRAALRPDLSFVEEDELPPVRAPHEREATLARLAALHAA